MPRIGLVLCLTLILYSCDYGVKWEDDPYEVHWIDTPGNRTLVYSLGDGGSIRRVGARVVSVGSNKKYVVAKRRIPESETVQYYYISKDKDGRYLNSSEITQGPFTEGAFLVLKEDLGLPEFSREFE